MLRFKFRVANYVALTRNNETNINKHGKWCLKIRQRSKIYYVHWDTCCSILDGVIYITVTIWGWGRGGGVIWSYIFWYTWYSTYVYYPVVYAMPNNPSFRPDNVVQAATSHESSNGKIFPFYWSFVRGIHQSPMISPHKGQWRGTFMLFYLHLKTVE